MKDNIFEILQQVAVDLGIYFTCKVAWPCLEG